MDELYNPSSRSMKTRQAAKPRKNRSRASALCFWLFVCCLSAFAQKGPFSPPGQQAMRENQVPPALKDITLEQKLDEQLPLALPFVDEQGRAVELREYFKERPVVLAIVYYTCPMLCNQILNGATSALKTLSLEAGKDFEVVAVSFDPKDTPETARSKKAAYMERYGRRGSDGAWHFLTGDAASVKALTEAVGFRYRWDDETQQYIHASGIMIATPQGKLSRYLYGIEYAPKDLKFSLMEASQGKVGNFVDQVFLYCYHYDPVTGKYGPVIMNMIRLIGVATFFGIALLIFVVRRRRARGDKILAFPSMLTGLPLGFPVVDLRPASWVPFAPEQGSTVAESVDLLYLFLVSLTVFFGVLISSAIFYFAMKYRRRSDTEFPKPIEGSMKLESLWIIIPFIIVMVIFGWGANLYFRVFRPPSDPIDVYVVGKQWMWKFEHPDGQREINELHVPIGRRIKLTMGTEDVIHSLYVPAFRVKADVVPGRLTSIWWEPTKPGRYELYCAEYCGTQHSQMIGWVVVQEPAAYQAWLSGTTTEGGGSLASTGAKLFQTLSCNTCHRPDMTGRGPALEGAFGKQQALQSGQSVTIDENYIRESILTPRAKVVAGYDPVMPTFQGLVSEEQLIQLVAYIKSLTGNTQVQSGGGAAPAGSAQPAQPASPTPQK